ncbi:hypothetical protein [Alienimonas californiensis]|uniref:Uncharacterized protein n=1 Tax=Alienimonas californiensis TaxID=2527989 RepID=A0A517PDN5_9PLAN|nr:hypothetical protein [Alienimonas californiensis]QDT17476.1 hypothetical protein CA12_36010 [Alienimonas californiensis]
MPKNLRAINERLAATLSDLCGTADTIVLPGEPIRDSERYDRIVPWGVEPHTLRWLAENGVRPQVIASLPDSTAARAVNSRRWQWETEQALGLIAGEVVLCELLDDLAAVLDALAKYPRGWVLKAEHGGSGRGLRFGMGPFSEADAKWAHGVFQRGLCVTAEPRDDRAREYSAHLTIRDDSVTFDGVCFLHSTPTGRFRSAEPLSRLSPALLDAVPIWTAVGERARESGYRGPMGVDAAAAWGVVERPVRDVNARWTMGRIALATGREVRNP